MVTLYPVRVIAQYRRSSFQNLPASQAFNAFVVWATAQKQRPEQHHDHNKAPTPAILNGVGGFDFVVVHLNI